MTYAIAPRRSEKRPDHERRQTRGRASYLLGRAKQIARIIHTIVERTSEIQQLVISRAISGLRVEPIELRAVGGSSDILVVRESPRKWAERR